MRVRRTRKYNYLSPSHGFVFALQEKRYTLLSAYVKEEELHLWMQVTMVTYNREIDWHFSCFLPNNKVTIVTCITCMHNACMQRCNSHRDITDRIDKPAWNLSARARVIRRVRLSLSNAVRVDKDRKTSHRLSLSLSPSFQTEVATYRATYGLSTLSAISLW